VKTKIDSTYEGILNSALKLFAKQGFKATTIRQIADDAGVNSSGISYHFNGKEDLYKALFKSKGLQNVNLAVEVLEARSKKITWEEFASTLEIFSNLLVKIFYSNSELMQVINREMSEGLPHAGPEFLKFETRLFESIKGYIEYGKKQGLVKGDLNAKYSAISLVTELNSHFIQRDLMKKYFEIDLEDTSIRQKFFDQVVQTFLSGIRKSE
jgi:AcrR family transcriptional regulator